MGTAASPRRHFATALTLLYLFLVGVVPLAHARAEGTEPTDVAHMVEWGKDTCPPVHDHAHCPVCKLTSSELTGAPAPGQAFEQFDRPSGVLLFHRVVDVPPAPLATPPSRAPPLA